MDKAVFARNPDSLVAVSHLLTRASFLRRLNEDALPVTAHTFKLLYCKYEDLRKSRGDMAKIELSKGEADVLIYACKAVKEEYFSLPEFEHLCATCDSQIKYWQSVYRVVGRGYKRYTAEQLKLIGDILDMILGDVDYRRGKWLLAHTLPPIKEKMQERIEYGPLVLL